MVALRLGDATGINKTTTGVTLTYDPCDVWFCTGIDGSGGVARWKVRSGEMRW